MKRLTYSAALFLVIPTILCGAEFKFGTQTITVPDGFQIELIAGPPLVDRPIEADFDEHGRLYVTDSSGSNDKSDKQLQDRPHRIVRLEDTDGDGRFDKSVVFADQMMFPEGAMWCDGSLYVAAPPSIWKLTDSDGDGKADRREEWFQGKTLTGCANDLHGPYLGPDGWIYWCKGAFAKQTHERPGKPPFVTRAAHIFRCRPNGRDLEPVMTGGMDNPVGLVFTPAGERIFSTTFFQQPAAGKRDGLVHAIYGGVYGKPNDATDDHKKTGELMPVLTHLGPAAPCGLARCSSDVFSGDDGVNLFACQFNLHKVSRHILEPSGATFRTRDSDFLVSDSNDFHPTDVLEDADGSLIVIDTGGWYKLCCPTSQLHKPDVLGAIYRVKRKGAAKIEDPRGLKVVWSSMAADGLARLLGDARPAVAQRAIHVLAKAGEKSAPALRDVFEQRQASRAQRQNAVWALSQIDSADARIAVRRALEDSDEGVCITAIHSASIWRDGPVGPQLTKLLAGDCSPHVKRAAAEALGRIGGRAAVSALLSEAGKRPDRVLEHSLIYAVIEIADARTTTVGLRNTNAAINRAALIALDQMDGGNLEAEQVIFRLDAVEPEVRQTAEWILVRHPEWARPLVPYFEQGLRSGAFTHDAPPQEQLHRLLKAFAAQPPIQKVLAGAVANSKLPTQSRSTALRAMAQSGLKELPAIWREKLEQLLVQDDSQFISEVTAVARAIPISKHGAGKLAAGLLDLARDETRSPQLRLDAISALPAGSKIDDQVFQFLAFRVDPEKPVQIRSAAVAALGKARLTDEQLLAVADLLKKSGSLEIPKLLPLFAKATNEAIGLKLISNIKDSNSAAALQPDMLRSCFTNFPASVQTQVDQLVASMHSSTTEQRSRLEQIHSALPAGDIRRGQAIFNSTRTACSSCHAIGYLGGHLGPDLTRIGQVRTDGDLLESIVYPSISFVRSYEPMVVATKSGDQFNGILRRDAADEVVLATGPDAEIHVARIDVAEMRPGTISVMPEGLDQQLSRQELADLLAFLRATKW